ncbi:NRAMP family divalent metal transporter [Pedobacter cryophilus]|uniref:Divalent metal cation transporter n=1 Tax=Pedobacter cryophilus TaxID=2571271 RepID=A0A4U1C4Z6_9SPHI|nr:NRAMP family divalent metal transporter [Pedobacter cryophilus]TKC00335.1 divalent metal cation transporter [Pedobacter cryophilus]
MKKSTRSILVGAAFLMATSAIGPGFLTQTAVFTEQLGASFGFVILISVFLDAIAQLNIWRVIAVSNQPAQEIANLVLPGLGYFLSFLVFLGGLAFNIGNVAGAGLGLNVLFGISIWQGCLISAILAIAIFIYKEAGALMDWVTKLLGLVMITLTCYIAYSSSPPIQEAVLRTFVPLQFSFPAVLTIVGGTVGGYITFAGAHRLLEAGITGQANLKHVNQGAVTAIGIASLMRILLFLAAFGVVYKGFHLDPANPPASIFRIASGEIGYKLFGLVMWSAAITSVVGSAYTSVSFIKSFHPLIVKWDRPITILFILISTGLFLSIGKPIKTLIYVGALNGMILPVSLGVMLIAAYKTKIVNTYKHPLWLSILGGLVVIFMAWMGYETIFQLFQNA